MRQRIDGHASSAGPSHGFTLVEVSIIVLTLATLASILLPQIGGFLRDARLVRAREDVGALGVAMMNMLKDTGESSFWSRPMGESSWRSPDRFGADSHVPIGLLIGDGDTPDAHGSTREWQSAFGSTVDDAQTDFGAVWVDGGLVDTFANHLIQNAPRDDSDTGGVGDRWARYRTPADMSHGDHSSGVPGGLHYDPSTGQGFNSDFAWRGPYLDAVRPDPWGNRYMANVLWLTMPQDQDGAGFMRAVVVVSAGPDEQVDTPFGSVGGFVVGDDDIAYPVTYGTLR